MKYFKDNQVLYGEVDVHIAIAVSDFLLEWEAIETKSHASISGVVCSCGGVDEPYHPVGENGCLRYHVTDPKEIPHNRRRIYNPEWFKEPVWIWDIADYWITEYTLFHQRMYSQDDKGNWTRPKSKCSVNSLEGDW